MTMYKKFLLIWDTRNKIKTMKNSIWYLLWMGFLINGMSLS